MSEILLRVRGTVLRVPADSKVVFDAGIDVLSQFDVGDSISMEMRIVDLDGDRMVMEPVGIEPREWS